MQEIKTSGHPVFFNEGCYEYLESFLKEKNYSKLFFIVDSNTNTHCLPIFLSLTATDIPIEIIEIEPGEINKNIETCIELWRVLTDLGADRKSLIINLGGGVITDLGGFVASAYKRGVDFINVPTSLLAMVDASVGGKTGVDFEGIKNQIGFINTPAAVLIDVQYLETLPQREMRSGLAEMLKHGLIADKNYWDLFSDLKNLTTDDLTGLIYRSVEIKSEIVSQDLHENNIRKILNFGHTLGHAIESYYLMNQNDKKMLLHGEAIAIGMVLESYISLQKNLISIEEFRQIENTIYSIFEKVVFTAHDIEEIMSLIKHDKKNVAGKVNFVLLNGIGRAKINKEVDNKLIYNAFKNKNE